MCLYKFNRFLIFNIAISSIIEPVVAVVSSCVLISMDMFKVITGNIDIYTRISILFIYFCDAKLSASRCVQLNLLSNQIKLICNVRVILHSRVNINPWACPLRDSRGVSFSVKERKTKREIFRGRIKITGVTGKENDYEGLDRRSNFRCADYHRRGALCGVLYPENTVLINPFSRMTNDVWIKQHKQMGLVSVADDASSFSILNDYCSRAKTRKSGLRIAPLCAENYTFIGIIT